jgi:NTP pyrophosphatase (non-canonical NTP hydrolase)
MNITQLVIEAHTLAASKGFWQSADDAPPNIPEKLMLVVSELSEALEELRSGFSAQYIYKREDGKPEGFPYELADAVIRIADLCGYLGIDLELRVQEKMDFNARRPHKHGRSF